MKSNRTSLAAGRRGIVGLALLAFSFTAGGSAVRAADPETSSTLQNVVIDPIANIVMGIERRLAGLETAVTAFAGSFTAERIVAQQLCVADGSGAQTCITKAQLDALLKGAVEVSQAPAATEQPAAPAGETGPALAAVTATPPDVTEQPAVAADESAIPRAEVAAVLPPATAPATEQPAAAAEEAAAPPSEVAAVLPSAATPATEQPAVTAGEPAAPLAEIAAVVPPALEPVETVEAVVAEGAKPETVLAVERAKDKEPAQTGSVAVSSPAPESNVAPAEERPGPGGLE